MIDLMDMFENPGATHVSSISGDDFVREMLENAKEQGFNIMPFEEDGQKQYNIWKMVGGEEIAFNPILEGDWIEGFEPGSKGVVG